MSGLCIIGLHALPTSGRRPGFTRRLSPCRPAATAPWPGHSQSERSGGRFRRRLRQPPASEACRRGGSAPSLAYPHPRLCARLLPLRRPSRPPLRIPPRQPRGVQRFGGRRPVVPRGRECRGDPAGAGRRPSRRRPTGGHQPGGRRGRRARVGDGAAGLPSEPATAVRVATAELTAIRAIQAGDRLIRTCRHCDSSASAASASEPFRLHLSR